MVEFTCHTQISAAREDVAGFPLYAYRLTPIDELKACAGDTTRDFVDTIGVLTEVSDAHMVQLPNKPQPTLTRHVILRDARSVYRYSKIKVSLWGERSAAFNANQVPNPVDGKPVVVLLVGDNYYLSCNTAARWYFNPDIAEARQFYSSRKVSCTLLPNLKQRLLQLNEMDPYDFSDDGFRCTVAVGRLVPNASWWFASCTRCSKSCGADGGGYRCNSCSSMSFRFKYKLCFVAMDGTDEAEMICFGDVARHIVGKPVQQVLRMATPANQLPADIAKIVSRRFTFRDPVAAPAVSGSPPADDGTGKAVGDEVQDTPPPTLSAIDTPPPPKEQQDKALQDDPHAAARRKLTFEDIPGQVH
ncbi:uncharacterized protein [Miscanthus floridulus]|uniref:uncharacterized protein n=1 Tax=Miscanthus floridulus TaxID=154761 RepID=UPI00345AA99E